MNVRYLQPIFLRTRLQGWSPWALSLITGLRRVSHIRPECTFAFPQEQWHASYANKPLSVWIKVWVNTEYFQWFLSKICNVNQSADLLRQVYFQEQPTVGMTLAHIDESWAFSFPKVGSPWLSHYVAATEYRQEGGNIIREECEIAHLANETHASHWRQKMNDWGRDVAGNNTIGLISGYMIKMYPCPREHGHPHVHLVDPHSYKTLAKFRIDKFERMEGPPRWDTPVSVWVDHNRDELMLSWERCQRGAHPYRIAEDA